MTTSLSYGLPAQSTTARARASSGVPFHLPGIRSGFRSAMTRGYLAEPADRSVRHGRRIEHIEDARKQERPSDEGTQEKHAHVEGASPVHEQRPSHDRPREDRPQVDVRA